jgi:hypothetical protein
MHRRLQFFMGFTNMEAFEEHDAMLLWWPDAYTTMLQRPYNQLQLSSNHFEENKLQRQVLKLNSSLRNALLLES